MSMLTSQRVRKAITVLLWMVGLIVATAMLYQRPAGDAQALAWNAPVQLAAPDDGVLVELAVELHEVVEPGQLIARLDPAPLLAKAEILKAELQALEFSESADVLGRSRRFETDREDARLEQAKLRASLAEDRARLTAVETELARERQLVADGLRAPSVVEDLTLRAESMRARIDGEQARMDAIAQTLESASARVQASRGPNRFQIAAAQRRLDEIYQRLERLELRSPISGQVTQVNGAAGEWFDTGQPVARVSPSTSRVVHVWTDGRVARQAKAGDGAMVRRAGGERLAGRVDSVAVERQSKPPELWYRPNTAEWGYLIRVLVPDPGLAPGEQVRVSLR